MNQLPRHGQFLAPMNLLAQRHFLHLVQILAGVVGQVLRRRLQRRRQQLFPWMSRDGNCPQHFCPVSHRNQQQ